MFNRILFVFVWTIQPTWLSLLKPLQQEMHADFVMVFLIATGNRRVQRDLPPICFVVLWPQIITYSDFDPISHFRLLGKEVKLITCHAKITAWKQKRLFGLDQWCASVSNYFLCNLSFYSHEVFITCLISLCGCWYCLLLLYFFGSKF